MGAVYFSTLLKTSPSKVNNDLLLYFFLGLSFCVKYTLLLINLLLTLSNNLLLLKATTFGVAFVAEDGGALQVTWGTSGNATAVGVGEGLGAFGGSGSWKKV